MGFKHRILLTCDGPCGVVLPETEKAPPGWRRVNMMVYERLEQGQKPAKKPLASWLCPKCSEKLVRLFETNHFCFSTRDENGVEP